MYLYIIINFIYSSMDKLFIGVTGLISSVVATPLILSSPDSENAVINAVVQVVIAVATLLGIIRRRRK